MLNGALEIVISPENGCPSSRMRKIADANVRFAGTAINTVGRHLRFGFGLPRLLLVGTFILLPCVGSCPGILVPVKRQLGRRFFFFGKVDFNFLWIPMKEVVGPVSVGIFEFS